MLFGPGAPNEVDMSEKSKILVTGATGYVGGRLIARLLAAGHEVHALGRSLEKMAARHWACHPNVKLLQGDVNNQADILRAARSCSVAYYLVHAMNNHRGRFDEIDRRAAENMKNAAAAAGLRQIIYLGGLGDIGHPHLSLHLASRHEVGRVLASGPVPATILRAAMILGSGSASFEILRYLVHRLPVMITPKWVHSPTQPIAISNVLDYLVGCLDNPHTYGRTFDIGGPDRLTYQNLIEIFADEAGLPARIIAPVPLLTPKISALWIHLVTPVPASIALPLTEGLAVPTICRENRIREIVPVKLKSCRQAIRIAIDQVLGQQVESCWSDSGEMNPHEWVKSGDAAYAGGSVLTCAYRVILNSSSEKAWRLISGIGGQNGYFFGNWLWRARGIIDRWVGGYGLDRGRRDSLETRVGDALDFWRILRTEPPARLSLAAEMKMPGRAVLDLQLRPVGKKQIELCLVSRFRPQGLAGLLYWYSLYPWHVILFKGMLKAIGRKAGGMVPGSLRRWQLTPHAQCRLDQAGQRHNITPNLKFD